MKNLTPIIMIMTLFLVGMVSSEIQTLGVVKQSESINLVQNCLTSSYSNITRIVYPNRTFAINGQTAMVKNGDDYSYLFSDTNALGQYIVYGTCDESGTKINWVYDFSVTATGTESTTSTAIFYISFLVILIASMIFVFTKLASSKDFGQKIGYAAIIYFLLLSILFSAYQISLGFLSLIPYLSTILYIFFILTLIMMFPLFLIAIIYLMSKIATEKDINKMVDMGYSKEEARKIRR